MIFGGIRKLTLLDYPGKAACTLFTVGCNFACPFCQNTSLIHPTGNEQVIYESDVFQFLNSRKGLLDGVCISGGEPLMQCELGSFIKEVKALGFLVKLDTNGSFPERLKELIESGAVDYVSMDIKNSKEKYSQTIGLQEYDLSLIEESIDYLLKGMVPYEFRTTVVREFHTKDDLISAARRISGAEKYYLQKFVKSDNISQCKLTAYSDSEMMQLLSSIKTILPNAELRGVN